ncbi:MAG: BlaI/MecI/CopY family transcriptional regulator [Bacteroides sp.]|nr:BlaI/MecI/CopY family transcriptional regulator [Bacteroides sp.]
MKPGRKRQILTEKETEIMDLLWTHGPLFVKQMVAFYPEPQPHFNTVSTIVRILETKGYVKHEVIGASHRFEAIVDRSYFQSRTLADIVCRFFGNSYKSAVSALVADEKISIDELKEIVDLVEKGNVNNDASEKS